MEMITSLPVMSLITSPKLRAGTVQVTGVAYGGEGEVIEVDVSTDLGRHWEPATLGSNEARYAWRLWSYVLGSQGARNLYPAGACSRQLNRFQSIEPFWNPEGARSNVNDCIRVKIG